MADSFKDMKLVSGELLQDRMDTVKLLTEKKRETYDIMKDILTGEHYLHYSYSHIDVAQGGEEEIYHQLLPLEYDDVLAVILGEQAYTYPDHWRQAFLRNGPADNYVWFDPGDLTGDAKDATSGRIMAEKLRQLKQQGKVDEEAVRQLFDDLDDLFKDRDGQG